MQKTGMEGSTSGYAESAESTARRITESAQQTLDRITRAAQDAAERLSERTEELWELQGRAMQSARGYAKDHPLVTVGIAIAVGVLLSRLLSTRK